MGTTANEQAFLNELNNAYKEYIEARMKFVVARIECDSKHEKFRSARKFASEGMSPLGWWKWKQAHKDVRFYGMPIGDAILELLRAHAHERAWDIAEGKGKKEDYRPEMGLSQIVEKLEAGGFEFKSSAARREVNAALLRTKGIIRDKMGFCKAAEAKQILESTKRMVGGDDQAGDQAGDQAVEHAEEK